MASVPVVGFPIIFVIRVLGLIVAALLLTWTTHFRGGMALISDNKDLIFNVCLSIFLSPYLSLNPIFFFFFLGFSKVLNFPFWFIVSFLGVENKCRFDLCMFVVVCWVFSAQLVFGFLGTQKSLLDSLR